MGSAKSLKDVIEFDTFKVKKPFFSPPRFAACGILLPQPGIKPMPFALEAQGLNHWTTREVPFPFPAPPPAPATKPFLI